MKKIIVILLPLLIILFACHNKTQIVMEKRYDTPDEEIAAMKEVENDSFLVNKIAKPVNFKIENSSTITFEVNTLITDGYLCEPVVNIQDSLIHVTYKRETDNSRNRVYDLIYPVTLVYQVTDIKPLEKNYTVLFSYPQK